MDNAVCTAVPGCFPFSLSLSICLLQLCSHSSIFAFYLGDRFVRALCCGYLVYLTGFTFPVSPFLSLCRRLRRVKTELWKQQKKPQLKETKKGWFYIQSYACACVCVWWPHLPASSARISHLHGLHSNSSTPQINISWYTFIFTSFPYYLCPGTGASFAVVVICLVLLPFHFPPKQFQYSVRP